MKLLNLFPKLFFIVGLGLVPSRAAALDYNLRNNLGGDVFEYSLTSGPPPIKVNSKFLWIQSYSYESGKMPLVPGSSGLATRKLGSFQLINYQSNATTKFSLALPFSWSAANTISLFSKNAFGYAAIVSLRKKFFEEDLWEWSFGVFLPSKRKPFWILPALGAFFTSSDRQHTAHLGFPSSFYQYQLDSKTAVGLSLKWRTIQALSNLEPVNYLGASFWDIKGHLQRQIIENLFFSFALGADIKGRSRVLNSNFEELSYEKISSGLNFGIGLAYQFNGRPPRL